MKIDLFASMLNRVSKIVRSKKVGKNVHVTPKTLCSTTVLLTLHHYTF